MGFLFRFIIWLGRLYTGFHPTANCKSKNTAANFADEDKCCNNNISTGNTSTLKQKYSSQCNIRRFTKLSKLRKGNYFSIPFHWPVCTIIVSILQLVCFELGKLYANNGWVSEGDFEANHLKRHEIWRIITSLFVHDGETHLWNVLQEQMLFGCALEIVHGWKPVLMVYLGGALISDLADLLEGTGLLGCTASGSLSAIYAGCLVTIILNWNEISNAAIRFGMLFVYVFAQMSSSIWLPVVLPFVGPEIEEILGVMLDREISHSSHIGGLLAGFIFGISVLKSFQPHRYQVKVRSICRILAIIVLVVGIGSLFFNPLFYWKTLQRQKIREMRLSLKY